MFSYTIPSILQRLAGSYTWKVKTPDNKLFLTFDDGPHPEITPWVLEQLRAYNARSTFFCVGDNVRKYPGVYADILANGHTTGNHTYHHISGWKHTIEQYEDDIQLATTYINSRLFRPPYGQIKPSQGRRLKHHYRIVMWNYLSGDFNRNLNRAQSLQKMKQAGPGSIMVFHDSEKAFENLRFLLPQVLAYFSSMGYSFESIPSPGND